MKFSSSLKFNAVAEWWDDYIAYDALKKYIYQLEKQQAGHENLLGLDIESNEQSSLLRQTDVTNTDAFFIPLLDRELKKIVLFYEHQAKELLEDLEDLEKDVELQEELGLTGDHYEDYDEHTDDDESISRSPEGTRNLSRQRRMPSGSRPRALSSSKSFFACEVFDLDVLAGAVMQSPEGVERRHSISSVNGDDGDNGLEESYFSTTGRRGPLGRIAARITNLRDSLDSSNHGETIWTARSNYAYDTRLLFKRRITTLYISFTNLRSYVEINYSGFRKIIKKYDKVTFSELKDRYLHDVVELAPPFTQDSKDQLNAAIARLVDLYTKCVARGDRSLAQQQLRLHQRENIAWERDTVWRQMIGRERRGEGAQDTAGATLVQEPEPTIVDVPTPVGKFRITKRKILKVLAIAVFFLCLNIEFISIPEANRCLAILITCTFLWATEAIPLFVTSLLVPFLLVILRCIRNAEGNPLTPHQAASFVFSSMFSPTIMLLIGGFTISSALSKTNIDRVLITRVLSFAGTRPSTVLLAFMGVSCFASMWISNVAAPTLCFTLIRPILRTLPPKSAFGPCLILAIALAANIGGQSSPISSPQNLIALAEMKVPVTWLQWFAVAIPVSAISIVLIWLFLLMMYQPHRSPDGEGEIEIKPIRPTRESFTLKQYWVTFICILTISMWCFGHAIEEYVGDMGVIALIPIIAFFSTNVLKKDDFEHFAWSIVFLAMGGIALGKGVVSSGLFDVLGHAVRRIVANYSLIAVVWILAPITLVVSTFISHTIASVLLAPIAAQVGESLNPDSSRILIFVTALICSAGMGMPVSGFPNQTAATQEDEMGELYLSNVDFLKNGVPASIIATLVVVTVGFSIMLVLRI